MLISWRERGKNSLFASDSKFYEGFETCGSVYLVGASSHESRCRSSRLMHRENIRISLNHVACLFLYLKSSTQISVFG